MADDKAEDAGLPPDAGRARRPPPTIDLEATEVATEPQQPAGEIQPENILDVERMMSAMPPGTGDREPPAAKSEQVAEEPEPERADADAAPDADSPPPNSRTPISPWVIAPFSGAVAAALVIGVGWMLGWPAVQAPSAVQTPAAPQVTMASVDALGSRLASVEAKVNKPAAPKADAMPDPATTSRSDALEKSLSVLRSDVANLHSQSGEPANSRQQDRDDAGSAPRDAAAVADLSAINERIASLESGIQAQRAELVQLGEKAANAKSAADKADSDSVASDKPLRRVVAAALLDVTVRQGDAYASQLSVAKSLAANPDGLKPLETFASSGVPSPAALSRELLNIVPKLSPPAQAQTNNSGIVDRMQAGAKTFFHVERIDGAAGSAIISRVKDAALRNDFDEARRELRTLPETDREPAKAWLDKADAREAALAASHKFANDAMAELAKPAPNKPALNEPALDKPALANPAEQQPAQ